MMDVDSPKCVVAQVRDTTRLLGSTEAVITMRSGAYRISAADARRILALWGDAP